MLERKIYCLAISFKLLQKVIDVSERRTREKIRFCVKRKY